MNIILDSLGLLLILVGLVVSVDLLDFANQQPQYDIEQVQQEYKKLVDGYLDTFPKAESEDAKLLVPDLIRKYGYPEEEHILTTADGYILKMHRIRHGKSGPGTGQRKVAFLQHGLLCSSADWLIAGPQKGFGYILADKGYDVWMGNARGNRYSRNHTTLEADCRKPCADFWRFDWHEIGTQDLPAMIDYTLAATGQEDLFYIGHSQGTTSFYVMASERPEYNKKIRAQFSLAPIAFMNHMTSPLLKLISLAEGGLEVLAKLIGIHEFLPTNDFISTVGEILCSDGEITQILCTNVLFVLGGFNKDQMNATMLPIMMGHTPAGASTRQLLHYAQEINSGKFRQWDYGLAGNMKNYGKISPPDYNLKKITAPVYLFYSHNDWLSAKVDVIKLFDRLPNVQGKFLISDDKFNHLDYLFAINVKEFLYDKVISLMNRHK